MPVRSARAQHRAFAGRAQGGLFIAAALVYAVPLPKTPLIGEDGE
jgi:hypothetical protein